jgi:hypothetical protein
MTNTTTQAAPSTPVEAAKALRSAALRFARQVHAMDFDASELNAAALAYAAAVAAARR